MTIVDLILGRARGPNISREVAFDPGTGARIVEDVVELDVALTEEEDRAREIFDHPIERGTPISDHQTRRPLVVRMTALVSDTPVAIEKSIEAAIAGGSISKDKYDQLTAIFDDDENDKPLIIATGFRIYRNMLFRSLSTSRRPDMSGALEFRAEFVEVLYANSQTIAIAPGDTNKAAAKTKPGKVQPKAPAAEATNESFLHWAIN